jgi:hypothetical protein
MGDGLIQFLVVAAFVIISMMDGAARKRRKQAQSLRQLPTPDGFSEAADDLVQADESPGEREPEGMVPQDLWKEIAALARGETPASRREQLESGGLSSADDPDSELEAWLAPEQDVSTKTRSADLQAGYLHPDQALTHREHAQVAFPVEPVPEEPPHEFVPHPPEQPSKAQTELRRTQKSRTQKAGGLLSGVNLGTRRSLRDAIIVAEVLGPPVTLRDLGWKPLF